MAKIKNYYAGSNSSIGFYSLYDEALKDLETLYILKGGPGTGKSTFMRKIGLIFMEKGYDLEYLHCSSDNQSIDGLIAPELKLGFVDGTAPHIIEPRYPGVVEKVIDLGQYRNDLYLSKHRDSIIELTDDISKSFSSAYKFFAEAKKIHLKREEIYVSSMDFKKADEVLSSLIDEIFSKSFDRENRPKKRKRFFGAATPKGAVNFIDNITEDINKRYIIKGRPGSGKSTLMKKIGKHAENLGLSVEYFLCAFDPKSIDMVIIPSISVAILDGTSPHAIDPFRELDEVVDMFSLCMDPKIETTFKTEINELNLAYKNKMTLATNYLSEAKRLHDKLEEFYKEAMDFAKIDAKREEIVSYIIQKP
ncbi:PRK06851 family protein [Fredinandcohnia quinoae]|uniref:PRK06851 family protein n=1 Tax=Fredinandcohnia quinoae TaxID=2918902 RepID=A0AAW5E4S2_9BACI|nr:PRK06851 family protein [Fredinandcohnia sp. SECRCQ15]MCH1627343.1 PRK06851 family protein [Fredinandcohnia sp. SECRCQ15]